MSKQHIIAAQTAFKKAGVYDITIDGDFGQGSLDAVYALIRMAGLEPPVIQEGQITENFTLGELTHSNTAVARKISNKPNMTHEQNLVASAINLWQPVRELLGQPMIINSGYRSAAVNKAVGGSATSAHSYGFAIDFVCPKFGNSAKTAEFLAAELPKRGIKFDQLILEFPDSAGSWIHLAYKNGAGQQRGQVLTAKKVGGRTKYLAGLHG